MEDQRIEELERDDESSLSDPDPQIPLSRGCERDEHQGEKDRDERKGDPRIEPQNLSD